MKISSMNVYLIGYFMKVGSQAKVMSKNNSIVTVTKGPKVNLTMRHIILPMPHIILGMNE